MHYKLQTNYKNRISKILTKSQVVVALFLFLLATPLSATPQEELNNVNQKINEANQKLVEIRSEAKTLQNQVNEFDTHIYQVQLEIDATQREIDITNTEIDTANNEIKNAEEGINKQKDLMKEYLRVMYIEGQVSSVELVVKSKSFSEFIDRSEYLDIMQQNVQETADQISDLKLLLVTKKNDLEQKKARNEQLKNEQIAKRSSVEGEKNTKSSLLTLTQGNEAEYQKLLQNLKAQQTLAQSQIWASIGSPGSGVAIKKGDKIGSMGNSGCSTGDHLHFEVRNNGSIVDPLPLINSGVFSHPLPGATITQYFGESWPEVYGPAGHPGIDFSTYPGDTVRAAADGVIITRTSGIPNTFPKCNNAYGNYALVDHGGGKYTLYGHLQ